MSTNIKGRKDCKTVVDNAVKAMGGVDIHVNNATYQMVVNDIKDLSVSEGRWVYPYFYMAKYTLPHLARGSAIINNASINTYIGRPDLLDYTSTKGAIISFTRGLSNEYVGRDIRVNAVTPGPVLAPLIPATITDEALKSSTADG